ncbi:MAG: HPF/RaiA family ribosome-associated protein [Planctomycetaceae bacterium]|uniref:Sigma 54 modulation protein / S30EA ribosomal protein n=1 Tax=Lacipirellula limnantheis TaxID=2528024 RepID=A0A517TZS9_9BACT|nr:HPF/RaiA family ribosome-associated protein [Lacipirellula limnantheis]MBL9163824.1 HPF/RaiA family ribosome-associated protein [Planctomycetaceae bacterium]QDT73865.1 hypothetical protein I41_30560 [Lacipirellula limnantheis]
MQIHVHTDNHVQGSAGLTAHVEAVVQEALDRFGNRVIRVEVHLGDENGHKKSDQDKRCGMEARLSNLAPIAVAAHGDTLDMAISGAIDKLVRTIDRTLDKKFGAKGRTSTAEFASADDVETEEFLATDE